MIFKSSIITEFKSTKLKDVNSVPVGNAKSFKALFGEDFKPYEFISTTRFGEDFPAQLNPWTDIVLTKEWAESFAGHINDVPKPVFIPGHKDVGVHAKERAIPDGYLVGAMVMEDKLYLRNSLPEGETDDQKALINQTLKEINAKMLSTSLTDVMEYKIEVNEDENTETYFATKSLKGQTNALVEADQTASEAEIIITSFKAKIDSDDEQEGEKQMGEKTMTNAEQFVALKNKLDSGQLALEEVADGLGIKIMTSKQQIALKRLNDAESKVGNISEFVTVTVESKEKDFIALKAAAIESKFKTPELIEIAESFFTLKEGNSEAITAEVERLSGLQVFKSIQGAIAGGVGYTPGTSESNEDAGTDSSDDTMEG